MRVLERDMIAAEIVKTADNNIDQYLPYCQASFNSDGLITLRNYDRANKNKDMIIILSESETKALFALFSNMGRTVKTYDIPF